MSQPKDNVQFGFYGPRALRDELDVLAKKESRSRNQVVRMLLEDALRNNPERIVGA